MIKLLCYFNDMIFRKRTEISNCLRKDICWLMSFFWFFHTKYFIALIFLILFTIFIKRVWRAQTRTGTVVPILDYSMICIDLFVKWVLDFGEFLVAQEFSLNLFIKNVHRNGLTLLPSSKKVNIWMPLRIAIEINYSGAVELKVVFQRRTN